MEKSESKTATTHTPIATPVQQQFELRRNSEIFFSLYANNVQVESNLFDLKLVFGVLDLRNATKPSVDQISGVNLSWPEVKLLLYFMKLHLALHELENGKVKIPTSALPPEIPSVLPPQFNNPTGRAAFELMRRLRAEFIATLSEP